ncbi:MAG: nickel/cobalt efflux transporter [Caulobacteraceae bacterium]
MPQFADLVAQGTANAWLFIPSAILLGALHGLEPGHSKTMMAAFVIAIRGTIKQAILLGLCATFSHTLIVWVIALGGMFLWSGISTESIEPYLQLASAVIIVGMAVWMIWRTYRDQEAAAASARHDHGGHRGGAHEHHHDTTHPHPHPHPHPHAGHGPHDGQHSHDEIRHIETGHGTIRLEIFEEGVPPRFRVAAERGPHWAASDVVLVTERATGVRQTFRFVQKDGYLESAEAIPEPHEFTVRITLSHGDHGHSCDLVFREHSHGDDHIHEELRGLDVSSGGYQDAHELAHANGIRRRFADRKVTTGQIILFGLTGGLIPCPGAITVLLLCLQLKQMAIGAALVLCFSVGLALTMVLSGVIAAISVRTVSKRWTGFGEIVRKAPYFSGGVILLIGLYMGVNGWLALAH